MKYVLYVACMHLNSSCTQTTFSSSRHMHFVELPRVPGGRWAPISQTDQTVPNWGQLGHLAHLPPPKSTKGMSLRVGRDTRPWCRGVRAPSGQDGHCHRNSCPDQQELAARCGRELSNRCLFTDRWLAEGLVFCFLSNEEDQDLCCQERLGRGVTVSN